MSVNGGIQKKQIHTYCRNIVHPLKIKQTFRSDCEAPVYEQIEGIHSKFRHVNSVLNTHL